MEQAKLNLRNLKKAKFKNKKDFEDLAHNLSVASKAIETYLTPDSQNDLDLTQVGASVSNVLEAAFGKLKIKQSKKMKPKKQLTRKIVLDLSEVMQELDKFNEAVERKAYRHSVGVPFNPSDFLADFKKTAVPKELQDVLKSKVQLEKLECALKEFKLELAESGLFDEDLTGVLKAIDLTYGQAKLRIEKNFDIQVEDEFEKYKELLALGDSILADIERIPALSWLKEEVLSAQEQLKRQIDSIECKIYQKKEAAVKEENAKEIQLESLQKLKRESLDIFSKFRNDKLIPERAEISEAISKLADGLNYLLSKRFDDLNAVD